MTLKHVVGFSGGIDSQAATLWVLNRYPKEDVIVLNSPAGGNEHPLTTEHVQWFSNNVHPVTVVPALIRDMWANVDTCHNHGLDPDAQLTFVTMATIKGRFPSRMAQFCTEKLKLVPLRRWIQQNISGQFERHSGIRRDESPARDKTVARCFDDFFNCFVNHPIYDWTKQMAFDYVQSHGHKVNDLYKLGFKRVGCAPCINSGKDDILAWAQRFPEMIHKVDAWEQHTGRTFFAPCVPGMEINFVRDVVSWAQTDRGGKQPNMFRVLNDRPACESAYGLCE
jgi:3'-phosphoadenosine 5'-phosphosulfate sulfotransferase (PAPS reductase)/FAD synthetase